MSFDADIKHLIGAFEGLQEFGVLAAERAMKFAANRSLVTVKRLTPRSKFARQHLRSGWKLRRVARGARAVRYEIHNDDPRATNPQPGTTRTLVDLLEFGTTGPILPINGSVLTWVDHRGNRIVARAVRGIRPYHMLRTAREQLVAEQAAIVQRFRTDALRQFTTLRRR